MKIFLIAVSIVLLTPFILGVIFAATKGRRQSYASALVIFASFSKDFQQQLKDIWFAYKQGDTSKVNEISIGISLSDLDQLATQIEQKGKTAGFTTMIQSLETSEYSKRASAILSGIVLLEIDLVLSKIR